jgi:hypothetical protein
MDPKVAEILLILVLFLPLLFMEVYLFVHAMRNPQITTAARLVWGIGMLLIHPFIAIIYFFTDYQKHPQI